MVALEAKSVRFPAEDGLTLEGRLAVPSTPRGVAVLCHPYPPLGGSMSNALLPPLQRALFTAGWAALRFNTRGVGRSEGSFDYGRGEVADTLAAVRFARSESTDVPSAIVGWSFGAIVGLIAAVRDGDVSAYAGIAPPVSAGARIELPALPEPEAVSRIRTLFVCGSEDPFAQPGEVRTLAKRYNAEVAVLEGAGHFFDGRHAEVCDAVVSLLASEEQEADRGDG